MPTNVSHAGCATKRAGDTTSACLYGTSYAEQSGREFTICKTADGRSRNGTSNSRLDSTTTEDDPHWNGGTVKYSRWDKSWESQCPYIRCEQIDPMLQDGVCISRPYANTVRALAASIAVAISTGPTPSASMEGVGVLSTIESRATPRLSGPKC